MQYFLIGTVVLLAIHTRIEVNAAPGMKSISYNTYNNQIITDSSLKICLKFKVKLESPPTFLIA